MNAFDPTGLGWIPSWAQTAWNETGGQVVSAVNQHWREGASVLAGAGQYVVSTLQSSAELELASFGGVASPAALWLENQFIPNLSVSNPFCQYGSWYTGGYWGAFGLSIVGGGAAGIAGASSAAEAEAATAAEEASQIGDQVVLGKSIGLEETAAKLGGRTLLSDPNWQQAVQQAIANPNVRISVALDGVPGVSTEAQVIAAAQRGLGGAGTPFDWEMGQLYQAGRLPSVNFVRGGVSVPNPFG